MNDFAVFNQSGQLTVQKENTWLQYVTIGIMATATALVLVWVAWGLFCPNTFEPPTVYEQARTFNLADIDHKVESPAGVFRHMDGREMGVQ